MGEVLLPVGAVLGEPCIAEPCGYTVHPVDIFAVGICILMMMRAPFLWEKASLGDSRFVSMHRGGLASVSKEWGFSILSQDAAELLGGTLSSEPALRPPADDCLADPWFADM